MAGNDISSKAFHPTLRDIRVALALLTRLPLPHPDFDASTTRPAAYAAWAYPLVGLVVGAIGVLAIWLALALGLPPAAAGLCAIGATVLATGAMHEDGLADCADGFWGGWQPERRLEIMKDSQIGTFGVLALGLITALRWVFIAELCAQGGYVAAVICAAVMSRAAMVWIMFQLPNARETGLSGQTGRPPKEATGLSTALFIVALVGFAPASILLTGFVAVAGTIGLGVLVKYKIGGQTGDVLGGTQQVVEMMLLAVFAAAIT